MLMNTTSVPTNFVYDNECHLRIFLLQPPLTYIYGTMLILTALVAAIGNTIALVVLWLPGQRSISNRILTSLAISDLLVGYILIPIITYQLFNESALRSCLVDAARVHIAILLMGSSAITLGIISYDRYLLLTKLNNYNLHMTNKKIAIMLTCAWIIPGIIPTLRLTGEYIYLPMIFFIFVLPLIALCINYCIITITIYKHEKLFRNSAVEFQTFTRSNATNTGRSNLSEKPKTAFTKVSSDGGSHCSNNVIEIESNGKTNTINVNQIKSRKERKRHLKLAKVVSILIACYSLCMVPLIMWMLLDFIDDSIKDILSSTSMQNLYIFSSLTSTGNSCINPFIYIAKNPEFKRGLFKLMRLKKIKKRASTLNFSSADFGKRDMEVIQGNTHSVDTTL